MHREDILAKAIRLPCLTQTGAKYAPLSLRLLAYRDEDQVVNELGMGSTRKKQTRRASRRRQAAGKKPGSRSRTVPEEINRKIGDASMSYTLARCVHLPRAPMLLATAMLETALLRQH